uniref:BEN domain-containing protein n=1 Tax=Lepisosteus oculatus TaxID=7918 RepID=W5MLG6_LEPOC
MNAMESCSPKCHWKQVGSREIKKKVRKKKISGCNEASGLRVALSAKAKRTKQRAAVEPARTVSLKTTLDTSDSFSLLQKVQSKHAFTESSCTEPDESYFNWMCPIESSPVKDEVEIADHTVDNLASDTEPGILNPVNLESENNEAGGASGIDPSDKGDLWNTPTSQNRGSTQSGSVVSKNLKKRPACRLNNTSVQQKTRFAFSKAQNRLLKEYMGAHWEDLYGPKRKVASERQSLWHALTAQINGLDGDNKKTLKQVQTRWFNMRRDMVRKAKALKQVVDNGWLTKLPHSEIRILNACHGRLDGIEDGKKNLQDSYSSCETFLKSAPTQPACASSVQREPRSQQSTAAVSCISKPHGTLEVQFYSQDPAEIQDDLSILQATEPSAFTATNHVETEIHEEGYDTNEDGTLSKILNYCKVMHKAIQRLDQKIDSLQSTVSEMQKSHRWPLFIKRKPVVQPGAAAHSVRAPVSCALDSTPPMPQLVRVCSPPRLLPAEEVQKPPRLSPAPGAPSPTLLCHQGQHSQPPPPAISSLGPDSASVAVGSKSKDAGATTSAEERPMVLIGNPQRKVLAPASALLKASTESSPRGAVGYLLRGLFSSETLSRHNVTGVAAQGILQLDPNKIGAIREWLASTFPSWDMGIYGEEWEACVIVMNNITCSLHSVAKRRVNTFELRVVTSETSTL